MSVPPSSRVYFLQCSATKLIKIGVTNNLDARIKTLQRFSPGKLVLLASLPGTKGREARLHALFKHARTHGEWFSPVPEILDYIRQDEEYIRHRQGDLLHPLQELVEATGLSREVVRKAIRQGQLPGRKIGREYVVDADELQAFRTGVWKASPRRETGPT